MHLEHDHDCTHISDPFLFEYHVCKNTTKKRHIRQTSEISFSA